MTRRASAAPSLFLPGSSQPSRRMSMPSSGSSPSLASSNPTSRETRWAEPSLSNWRAGARRVRRPRSVPPASGRAAEARFAQLSLGLIAATPRAARPALLALARTRLGRFVLCYQLFGYPSTPAGRGGARLLQGRLGRTGVQLRAEGARRLPLQRAGGAPPGAGDDRLGNAGPPAAIRAPGAAGTRDAAMGHAPNAWRRTSALLRRSRRGRRRDSLGRSQGSTWGPLTSAGVGARNSGSMWAR